MIGRREKREEKREERKTLVLSESKSIQCIESKHTKHKTEEEKGTSEFDILYEQIIGRHFIGAFLFPI
jgi:hypothetical protein